MSYRYDFSYQNGVYKSCVFKEEKLIAVVEEDADLMVELLNFAERFEITAEEIKKGYLDSLMIC